jgi:hypothetical protein
MVGSATLTFAPRSRHRSDMALRAIRFRRVTSGGQRRLPRRVCHRGLRKAPSYGAAVHRGPPSSARVWRARGAANGEKCGLITSA